MEGINCIDDTGRTLLHIAIDNNDVETVKTLLENNADVNILSYASGETPLHHAVNSGLHEIAQCLIQYKPTFFELGLLSNVETLFYSAVDKGYTDIVKYLLEQGADVNATSTHIPPFKTSKSIPIIICNTALYSACEKNYPEIVEILMDYGADMNFKIDGKTALQIAVEKKHSKCVKSLLNR